MSYIENPEAVGDPDQTPIVQIPPDVVEAMRAAGIICGCGGMNGYHTDDCPGLVRTNGSGGETADDERDA